MFSTTLAAAAVGGLLVSGSLAVQPAWQSDYSSALVQSAEQRKPVAVFIAPGGHNALVKDGKIGQEAVALMRQSYICLDVDTKKESGKVVAASFGISEGLVISDKTGERQALRHGGEVTPEQLSKYLKTYSAGTVPTRTAIVNNAVIPSTTTSYAQPYRVCGPNGCSTVYSYPATSDSGIVRQAVGNTVNGVRNVVNGIGNNIGNGFIGNGFIGGGFGGNFGGGGCATGNCPYR